MDQPDDLSDDSHSQPTRVKLDDISLGSTGTTYRSGGSSYKRKRVEIQSDNSDKNPESTIKALDRYNHENQAKKPALQARMHPQVEHLRKPDSDSIR